MKTNTEVVEEFKQEFVKDNGEHIEPSFKDVHDAAPAIRWVKDTLQALTTLQATHEAEVGKRMQEAHDLGVKLTKMKFEAEKKKLVEEERARIVDLIFNAGKNNISKLCYPEERCNHCLHGFTGTHWISQNMLYFVLTGIHLNEAKEALTLTSDKDEEALKVTNL